MRVLMISIDKGLLGKGQLGDVVERHIEYGKHVGQLDIIVFSKKGFEKYQISENVMAYPTNSCCKLKYTCDAKKIGKRLLKENHYDLIVTQEPFLTGLVGYCLKRKFKVKLLVHFHGDFWQNKNWLKDNKLNWLFLLISKFVVSKADGVRVMSEGQKEKLKKFGDRVRVISTPVDLDKFDKYGEAPEQQKQINNLSEAAGETKFVLMVGRKDPVKDFPTLVKAINLVYEKQHPDFGLWLVGNHKPTEADIGSATIGGGGEYASVKKLKEELGIMEGVKTRFSGNIDSVDLPAYYKTSYLTVLSSTSESFGKVLVEANACGKPVVSTATTGAKEIIQDGYNGFLVPIGDYQALADKIIYLLDNPQRAKEMGENGRKLVKEKFGNNSEKIINFWHEIIRQ